MSSFRQLVTVKWSADQVLLLVPQGALSGIVTVLHCFSTSWYVTRLTLFMKQDTNSTREIALHCSRITSFYFVRNNINNLVSAVTPICTLIEKRMFCRKLLNYSLLLNINRNSLEIYHSVYQVSRTEDHRKFGLETAHWKYYQNTISSLLLTYATSIRR